MSDFKAPLDYDERVTLISAYCDAHPDGVPRDLIAGWEDWVGTIEQHLAACGSPIERILIMALFRAAPLTMYFNLATQHALGPYRVDMALHATPTPYPLLLVIEADGRAYHADNHMQVARDKRRDRFLAEMGLTVMRFTGAEIHADADACAAQAVRAFNLRDRGFAE